MTLDVRLQEYLNALDRNLNDWRACQNDTTKEKLKVDRAFFHQMAHILLTAIQTAIDIGNHLIAEKGLPRPSRRYREIFDILGEHRMIDAQDALMLAHLAEFRNQLIHEYVDLNLDQMLTYIKDGYGALRRFQASVVRLEDNSHSQ